MDSISPRKSRDEVAANALLLSATVVLFFLSWQRYATFHNETFDLAFYARIAWGMAVGDFYEPMLDAHVFGLHLAWVLIPLGWIGRMCGVVPTLLVAQCFSFFAAGFLLTRFARRKIGANYGLFAAFLWVAFPNLSHVFTYEFHPGNLALPFFIWAADAVDRQAHREAILASTIALCCREDLALVLVPIALLGAVTSRAEPLARRSYLLFSCGAFAYFVFFLFVVQPAHAPREGSLALHFGPWGNTVSEMLRFTLTHPSDVIAHVTATARIFYVPAMLFTLGVVVPFLGARWILPALPILAVNLLSHFPGTADVDSHYLTPAVPFLLLATVEGVARYRAYSKRLALVVTLGSAVGMFLWSTYPGAQKFHAVSFKEDARSASARSIVAKIGPVLSVQAPYALLPHLAERKTVRRAPPPDLATDVVVLDAWQREKFLHLEDLIRTEEEPVVRDWLAKPRRKLVAADGNYLMFVRGDPRSGIGAARALLGTTTTPDGGQTLTRCLGLEGAHVIAHELQLSFAVREPCASDLAMRLGEGDRPRRVDLLFGGLFSPAHLVRGDHAISRHALSADEEQSLKNGLFRIGLIRQSGARPEFWDANSIALRAD